MGIPHFRVRVMQALDITVIIVTAISALVALFGYLSVLAFAHFRASQEVELADFVRKRDGLQLARLTVQQRRLKRLTEIAKKVFPEEESEQETEAEQQGPKAASSDKTKSSEGVEDAFEKFKPFMHEVGDNPERAGVLINTLLASEDD